MARTERKLIYYDSHHNAVIELTTNEYRGRNCGCCYKYRKKERRANKRRQRQLFRKQVRNQEAIVT